MQLDNNRRTQVFKYFGNYAQGKDLRTMDQICKKQDNRFELQVQQSFLKDYLRKTPSLKKLLLYHEIGSGKTCTAITLAEEFLQYNPEKRKIVVILPARLKTNFIDELMSECSFYKYISKSSYDLYMNPNTTEHQKSLIKRDFLQALHQYYHIYSFEGFRKLMLTNRYNLISFLSEFVQNTLFIVDEAHNFVSSSLIRRSDIDTFIEKLKNDKKNENINSFLFKILCNVTDTIPTSKMIMLSATPVFDNLRQFTELVSLLNPEIPEETLYRRSNQISTLTEFLRGRVSYFPGISSNAYPSSKHKYIELKITETLDIAIDFIREQKEEQLNDDTKESFMVKQRQASLVSLPGIFHSNFTKSQIHSIITNCKEYAPKIDKVVEIINNSPGKHVIYSNFIKSGILIVEQVLRSYGWTSYKEGGQAFRMYAIWDGSIHDNEKQQIKEIMNNSKTNLFGERIRVILGSPSIREGITIKHVQQMHILDPMWNISSEKQIEGRVIRYCSHVDIDEQKHTPLKRHVDINIYMLIPRSKGLVDITPDETIRDIINKKKGSITSTEQALRNVSIDYYLFKNLYSISNTNLEYQPSIEETTLSPLSVKNDIYLNNPKNRLKTKIKSTCNPASRRPIDGKCLSPFWKYLRMNNHNEPCCFATQKPEKQQKYIPPELILPKLNDNETITQKNNTCPLLQRPVNGECLSPYWPFLGMNKHNEPCCFKTPLLDKDTITPSSAAAKLPKINETDELRLVHKPQYTASEITYKDLKKAVKNKKMFDKYDLFFQGEWYYNMIPVSGGRDGYVVADENFVFKVLNTTKKAKREYDCLKKIKAAYESHGYTNPVPEVYGYENTTVKMQKIKNAVSLHHLYYYMIKFHDNKRLDNRIDANLSELIKQTQQVGITTDDSNGQNILIDLNNKVWIIDAVACKKSEKNRTIFSTMLMLYPKLGSFLPNSTEIAHTELPKNNKYVMKTYINQGKLKKEEINPIHEILTTPHTIY